MGFLLLATRIACSDERTFVFHTIRVATRSRIRASVRAEVFETYLKLLVLGVVRELLMPPGKRTDRVPTWLGLSTIAPACVA